MYSSFLFWPTPLVNWMCVCMSHKNYTIYIISMSNAFIQTCYILSKLWLFHVDSIPKVASVHTYILIPQIQPLHQLHLNMKHWTTQDTQKKNLQDKRVKQNQLCIKYKALIAVLVKMTSYAMSTDKTGMMGTTCGLLWIQ